MATVRAPCYHPGLMIRLRKLAKSYGDQPAVRGIDLEIPTGQLVGLLGPNGAGKSTTLKMLTGMLAPTSGSAEVEGFDVDRDPIEVKKIVGYVPESGAVFEALTAHEYLRFVAALYHIPDDEAELRIARFAGFFDLDGDTMTGKPLAAFSKGMRQKVVITSALLHNPRVVFFDEPLNGLDANAAISFKTLITSLARDGKTIVYCSHILDVVERVCERVVIIHEGRIVADGTVAELRERSGAATLEGAFNKLTATENLLARAEEFARALAQ
ncbi:MAG: ABC transporter ATP-binding protein [Candidatus Eiseniibacteriota bacterium]